MKQLLLTILFASTLNAKTFQGFYEVPVQDPILKEASLFDLQNIKLKQTDHFMSIKYKIPAELTGVIKNAVEFSGPVDNNHAVLTASNGNQMNCDLKNKPNISCRVQFKNLTIDNENAKKLMAAKFKDQELDNRLLVQQGFSTDPVGIVHLKLK